MSTVYSYTPPKTPCTNQRGWSGVSNRLDKGSNKREVIRSHSTCCLLLVCASNHLLLQISGMRELDQNLVHLDEKGQKIYVDTFVTILSVNWSFQMWSLDKSQMPWSWSRDCFAWSNSLHKNDLQQTRVIDSSSNFWLLKSKRKFVRYATTKNKRLI